MASGVTECRGVSGAGGAPASLTLQVLMYAAELVGEPPTAGGSASSPPFSHSDHNVSLRLGFTRRLVQPRPSAGKEGAGAFFPRFPLLLLFE